MFQFHLHSHSPFWPCVKVTKIDYLHIRNKSSHRKQTQLFYIENSFKDLHIQDQCILLMISFSFSFFFLFFEKKKLDLSLKEKISRNRQKEHHEGVELVQTQDFLFERQNCTSNLCCKDTDTDTDTNTRIRQFLKNENTTWRGHDG